MTKNDVVPVIEPFNPLDKRNLGESVAEAALSSPVHLLPPEPFVGAGVYILYYTGDNKMYQELSKKNQGGEYRQPIYVGKAVPAGARKGGFGLGADPGTVLYKRLCEHADSISSAENLELDDFRCRYLVVDDIWIPLAESLLIEKFAPVWNRVLDGFGNHDPGKGRYEGKMPFWDSVHPGRAWAMKMKPPAQTREELVRRVEAYLRHVDELETGEEG